MKIPSQYGLNMKKNSKIKQTQKKLKKTRKPSTLKKRQTDQNSLSLNPVFQMLPNPFAELNDERRMQVIRELAENSERKYQEALTKIRQILVNYDPISMLSILASYGLTVSVGNNGIQDKDCEREFHQFQLEICQALVLQVDQEIFQYIPVTHNIVQELCPSLSDLMSAGYFWEIEHTNYFLSKESAIKQVPYMTINNTKLIINSR